MKRKNEPRGVSLGADSTRSQDSTSADLSFVSKDNGPVMTAPANQKALYRDAKRARRTKTYVMPGGTMEEVVEISSDDESMEVDAQKVVELKYRAILNDTMRLDKRIRELQREKSMSEALLHDLDVEMRVIARENKRKFEVPTVQTAVSLRGKTIVLPDTLPVDVNDLPNGFDLNNPPKKFVEWVAGLPINKAKPTKTKLAKLASGHLILSSDEETELVYTQE